MGYAFCGQDDEGRQIGYGVEAVCDFSGCTEEIDRGMGWACGGMHGWEDQDGEQTACDKYFCNKHLHAHDCEALRLECEFCNKKFKVAHACEISEYVCNHCSSFCCDGCGFYNEGTGKMVCHNCADECAKG